MYDLLSDVPEERGLPDDFHFLQPLLLRETFLYLKVWEGEFHGVYGRWLRWFDAQNKRLATLDEKNVQHLQDIEETKQRVEEEKQRAETAEQRAELLAAKLRSLGIDPEQV